MHGRNTKVLSIKIVYTALNFNCHRIHECSTIRFYQFKNISKELNVNISQYMDNIMD